MCWFAFRAQVRSVWRVLTLYVQVVPIGIVPMVTVILTCWDTIVQITIFVLKMERVQIVVNALTNV